MNILYFIIALTLFLIDRTLDMPPKYIFFSSNFTYLFIIFFIHLYISGVLLYCYYLSLVSIDRLTKNSTFFNLFNRNLTLGA